MSVDRSDSAREVRAHLADYVLVGNANDKTVLGRGVLVLGLNDETLTSVVVGLTFATTTVLNLFHSKVKKRRVSVLFLISNRQERCFTW